MAGDRKSDDKKSGGSGIVAMAAIFGTVTVLAIGAGWYVGSQIRSVTEAKLEETAGQDNGSKPVDAAKDTSHASNAKPGEHGSEASSNDEHGGVMSIFDKPSVLKLDPIVSNIGTSGNQWVRLEIAVIYGSDSGSVEDVEKSNISEAIIAMLRLKDKSELSGPSGFLQFREDLVDTVMVSTEGRAKSAKILSMVVE